MELKRQKGNNQNFRNGLGGWCDIWHQFRGYTCANKGPWRPDPWNEPKHSEHNNWILWVPNLNEIQAYRNVT